MKDILIIAHFTQLPGEKSNGRFHYIANNIDKENCKVEVVTTNFSHSEKTHRRINKEQINNPAYEFVTLDEPGYKRNVSLRRIYSHYILGKNLKKYLNERKKPNVIYCSVPSLDMAKVAAEFANQNNIKFIIDVQDLWPEAFEMVFNIPIISDIIFYPMKKQADYIYSSADEIIAVSETYLERALESNKNIKEGHSIYLGTELKVFDELVESNKIKNKPKSEIWLAYIGTLGHSYDLITVIDALKILKDKGVSNIKFVVMGDGPLKSKFQKYAKEIDVYVEFTGRLSYEKMVGILSVCDIAVNPIVKGSAGSIINKVGDYAAAGLPVINTQESQEYRNLVDEYKAGYNCLCEDEMDIADKLYKLYYDKQLRVKMGENNRRLAEEKFDRIVTYEDIIKLV